MTVWGENKLKVGGGGAGGADSACDDFEPETLF